MSVGLSEGARFHELTYVARLQDEGFVHDEGCLCCSSRRGFSDAKAFAGRRTLLAANCGASSEPVVFHDQTIKEGRVAHDKGAANLWVSISGFCDWLCRLSGSAFNIQHGPNQRVSTRKNTANIGGVSISDNGLVEVNEASGLRVSLRSRERPRNLLRGSEFPSPWTEFALQGRTL